MKKKPMQRQQQLVEQIEQTELSASRANLPMTSLATWSFVLCDMSFIYYDTGPLDQPTLYFANPFTFNPSPASITDV